MNHEVLLDLFLKTLITACEDSEDDDFVALSTALVEIIGGGCSKADTSCWLLLFRGWLQHRSTGESGVASGVLRAIEVDLDVALGELQRLERSDGKAPE